MFATVCIYIPSVCDGKELKVESVNCMLAVVCFGKQASHMTKNHNKGRLFWLC